jgi:hypothetical protein
MCGQGVMTSRCIIQCHQVVLVVELAEAGTLSTCLCLHVWPMHQVGYVAEHEIPLVQFRKGQRKERSGRSSSASGTAWVARA